MPLSLGAEKLLKWMGPSGARPLQEILNWGPWLEPDDDHVRNVCQELVKLGYFEELIDADGLVVYRVIQKEKK